MTDTNLSISEWVDREYGKRFFMLEGPVLTAIWEFSRVRVGEAEAGNQLLAAQRDLAVTRLEEISAAIERLNLRRVVEMSIQAARENQA